MSSTRDALLDLKKFVAEAIAYNTSNRTYCYDLYTIQEKIKEIEETLLTEE